MLLIDEIVKDVFDEYATDYVGFTVQQVYEAWENSLQYLKTRAGTIIIDGDTAVFNKGAIYFHRHTDIGFQKLTYGYWSFLKKLGVSPSYMLYNGIPQFDYARKVISKYLETKENQLLDHDNLKFFCGKYKDLTVFIYLEKHNWFGIVAIVLFNNDNELREFLEFLK